MLKVQYHQGLGRLISSLWGHAYIVLALCIVVGPLIVVILTKLLRYRAAGIYSVCTRLAGHRI